MLSTVNVYGYHVRYLINENNTKMYLPSDLANQYNVKHSCGKRFKNWLCNKNTIEYLNYLESKMEGKILPSTTSKDEKWFIPNEIEFKCFRYQEKTWTVYTVSLKILHVFLNWIDMVFADTVWSFLSEEFEKGNSLVTKRIHNDYIKLQETVDELQEENKSLQTEIREIKNKVKHDTDSSFCPYEIDQYITFIRQKDSRTFEVKKLSKKFNKRAYKQFLYDHWKDCKTKEEIDEAIENGEEPEFSDTDLTIIYAKNNGVGESFKRYIINTLKDMLKDFDYIQKVTLNKIIFNRDITYDDIMQLRHLCKTIKTNIFTYNA
nr:hypothetical protein [uncultured Methanosphaera sp.]